MFFSSKLLKFSTTLFIIFISILTFFMPYSIILAPPTNNGKGAIISKDAIKWNNNYIIFSFSQDPDSYPQKPKSANADKLDSTLNIFKISFEDPFKIERLSYKINYFLNLITEMELKVDLVYKEKEIINLQIWFRLLQNNDLFIFLKGGNKSDSIKNLNYSVSRKTYPSNSFDKTYIYNFSYNDNKIENLKIEKTNDLNLNGNTIYLKAVKEEKTKFTLFKGHLFQYKDTGYGLQERIDNPLNISIKTKPDDGEIEISNSITLNKRALFEDWYLLSDGSLLNIDSYITQKYLITTDFSLKKRYFENGFYYLTDSAGYRNETKNSYYWDYSMYAPRSLLEFYYTSLENFIYDIAINSFYALSKNRNKDGFWSSGTESIWLKNDYGIGTYYFDTRFSLDASTFLIWVYKKFNNKEALKLASDIGNLILKFIDEGRGIKTPNNGFLLSDYIVIENKNLKTHSSLNHILNEIYFLLMLNSLTNNPLYKEASIKLLNGIDYYGEKWINKKNGDLYYCIKPLLSSLEKENSSTVKFEREDYTTLTYYDLIKVNKLIEENSIKDNKIIKKLCESKEKFLLNKQVIKVKKFTAGKEINIPLYERAK